MSTKTSILKNILRMVALAVLAMACDRSDEGLPADTLSVNRFEPLAALGTDTITIVGTGFSANLIENVVQFSYAEGTPVKDQVLATVISAEPTRLRVVVPEIAQVGRVKVGVGPYSALSDVPFLLSPSISSVNPDGGYANDQIAVQGKNFPTNLSQLLLYIGDTPVDSIFGGSSTQIVFPLPEGLAPGRTTIRVGIRLTPNDSVFAPAAAFTVFDPNNPSITSIEPESTVPGGEIVIRGNAFKSAGGTTTVTITVNGTPYPITPAPADLDNDAITLRVPAEIVVEDEAPASVVVTVVTADSRTYFSEPATFTIVEPSNIVFYFTALNAPGTTSDDDNLYRGEPIVGVAPTVLAPANFGVWLQEDDSKIYFGDGGVNESGLNGENIQPVAGIPTNASDISVSASGGIIFYYSFDDAILYGFNVAAGVSDPLISDYAIPHIKAEGDKIFWCGKILFGSVRPAVIQAYEGGVSTPLYSNAAIGTKFITGLAITNDKIFFVEGPTNPYLFTNTDGTSTIFVMNKNGTGVTALYSNLNEIITDLEVSEDGSTLYWMSSNDNPVNGGIKSAPTAADPTKITMLLPGIRNGRYLDVLEKE